MQERQVVKDVENDNRNIKKLLLKSRIKTIISFFSKLIAFDELKMFFFWGLALILSNIIFIAKGGINFMCIYTAIALILTLVLILIKNIKKRDIEQIIEDLWSYFFIIIIVLGGSIGIDIAIAFLYNVEYGLIFKMLTLGQCIGFSLQTILNER